MSEASHAKDDGWTYMSIWSASLELNGDSSKEQNLNSRSGSVPERARDTILVSD